MRDDMFCDPEWHAGAKVFADFFLQTPNTKRRNSAACCTEHLGRMIKLLKARKRTSSEILNFRIQSV